MDNKLIFENWSAFKDSERQRVKQEAFGDLFGQAPNPLADKPKGMIAKYRYGRGVKALAQDLIKLFSTPNMCFYTHTIRGSKRSQQFGGVGNVAQSMQNNGIYFYRYPEHGNIRPFLAPVLGETPEEMAEYLRTSDYVARNPENPTFIVGLPGSNCNVKDDWKGGGVGLVPEDFIMKYAEPLDAGEAAEISKVAGKKVQMRGGFNHKIPPKYIMAIIQNGKLKKA